MRKTIVLSVLMMAAGLSCAAMPIVAYKGDVITVVVPAGTAENATLTLCWGASDAGEKMEKWEHQKVLTENGVTMKGGVWSVSASEIGVSAADMMRAFLGGGLVYDGTEYKVVEYVESDQNNAGENSSDETTVVGVNTEILARSGLHVKAKMRWLKLSDSEFCGGRCASGDGNRIFPVHTYGERWFLGYGSKTDYGPTITTGVDYEVESKLYSGYQTMIVDGTPVLEWTESATVDTQGGPVFVFAAYYQLNKNYPLTLAAKARCYSLKIWENGNTTDNLEGDLVRDFIPVKDENGHGAFFDQENGKLYKSVSCGSMPEKFLTAGDETGVTVRAFTRSEGVCGVATVYDPDKAGGGRPSGFKFVLVPAVNNGQLSLSATFEGESVGGYSLDAFVAKLTDGESTVDGAVDWVEGKITFPPLAVDADVDAVFSLAYGEGPDERFVSDLPVRFDLAKWFGSTPSAPEADGAWNGAEMQDGRIAIADEASYAPYSCAKADLRMIEFTGAFGRVSGMDSAGAAKASFGIEMRETADGNRFFVVADGAWHEVADIEADPTAEYRVQVQLDRSAQTVSYYVDCRDGLTRRCGPYANAASADEVAQIVFEGAARLVALNGVRRGLVDGYAFNVGRKHQVVTVRVDPAAVTRDDLALVLCYDRKDCGSNALDWGDFVVLDMLVAPTGGTYTVDLAAHGIVSGRVRPFLVTGEVISLYESLSSGSGGIAYVDTGVPAKYGVRVETKMSWLGIYNDTDACYFGVRGGGGDTRLSPIYCYPGKWGYGYLTGHWNDPKTHAIENERIYEVESKLYDGFQELKVDGEVYGESSVSGQPDYSNGEFSVFSCNYISQEQHSYGCRATCYYLRIYVNGDKDTNPDGDLARDFVPAKEGEQCGLYDLRSQAFFPGSPSNLSCANKTNEFLRAITGTINHEPDALSLNSGIFIILR